MYIKFFIKERNTSYSHGRETLLICLEALQICRRSSFLVLNRGAYCDYPVSVTMLLVVWVWEGVGQELVLLVPRSISHLDHM